MADAVLQVYRGGKNGRPRQENNRPLELQGRQMRLVFRGSERPSQTYLQDAHGRAASRQTDHGVADEDFSHHQRSSDGRLLELSGQQEDSAVYAQAER